MTVLVIAPHPDDESIGCGGTLRLHADRGDRVVVVCLTSGEQALKHLPKREVWKLREAEAAAAAEVLGVARLEFFRHPDWLLDEHIDAAAEQLAREIDRESPAAVYVPHPLDAHPDHRASHVAFRRAVRDRPLDGMAAMAYEVWTPMTRYNHLVNVDATMAAKMRAVRCHASQLESFDYDQAARGLNRYRGAMQTQWRYAEAFLNLNPRAEEVDTGLPGPPGPSVAGSS
jgi:N-acetylglucosamine malate deacetylase 1